MSDYIKREDAVESARALLFCYGSDNIPDEQLDEYAEEFMNDDNTIIEVVRCKDCKHWMPPNTCGKDGYDWNADDYCSYGERKEQEHE